MVLQNVDSFIKETLETKGNQDSFVVINLDDIKVKLNAWNKLLPNVEPFYAVKCNDNQDILAAMAKWGMNFDCASMGEIKKILSESVDPSRIIYANPCKQVSHLQFAEKNGVRMMTFDNLDELKKIKENAPSATVVLRLATDDSKAICRLSQKFGAKMSDVPLFLKKIKSLGLEFGGFSYHVGSGCEDDESFVVAVSRAREAFDIAEEMGFNPTILDIGGGFSGEKLHQYEIDHAAGLGVVDLDLLKLERDNSSDSEIEAVEPDKASGKKLTFPLIANMIRKALNKYFFDPKYRIIAEPGRYFVGSAGVLMANVIARRLPISSSSPKEYDEPIMYYINEGVYGAFANTIYDHQSVVPKVLNVDNKPLKSSKYYESSVWGPSCDGLDCVAKSVQLPKLKVGQWLYFEDMGAYTVSCLTEFNGFKKTDVYCINGPEN